ncbi:alanine dehydrogenase [Vibrio sp. 10N.286.49.B3]|uniref:alanine dehydrogenase n=1 Tax=Vibrio sp. 10N.286.49.B3 TaxID=1880855 RepID=UPI000C82F96E|nr:alanine dehydrogenase [Vibrio sp. 10N.286.49.B3]PMH41819.1 alanine dehydrogenase [Vibrio sp. 10N.286.49.B3]
MIIGVPKEIKIHEYRVGMTPASVREVCSHGHKVFVESTAGLGIGCSDEEYRLAGAEILPDADSVFAIAEMIIKVKEPQAIERARLRPGQLLFTYLHLAPDLAQTEDLIASEAVCIAYETVTASNGSLPLLAPMSEVAGRMSIQAGAACLEKSNGGIGLLLGGVAGVAPAKVTIIGGGVVGANAAQMAIGLGADTTILDNNIDTLRRLNAQFGSQVKTLYSNKSNLEDAVIGADLVVGGVLIPGAAAPKLVSAEMVAAMRAGSAIVDVAIDQGGCFETSKVTTHDEPTYIVDDVVHYCVGNMPGALARTSAFALNNATLPYILRLANQGYRQALLNDQHLKNGLNVIHGKVTNQSVAASLDLSFITQDKALSVA